MFVYLVNNGCTPCALHPYTVPIHNTHACLTSVSLQNDQLALHACGLCLRPFIPCLLNFCPRSQPQLCTVEEVSTRVCTKVMPCGLPLCAQHPSLHLLLCCVTAAGQSPRPQAEQHVTYHQQLLLWTALPRAGQSSGRYEKLCVGWCTKGFQWHFSSSLCGLGNTHDVTRPTLCCPAPRCDSCKWPGCRHSSTAWNLHQALTPAACCQTRPGHNHDSRWACRM